MSSTNRGSAKMEHDYYRTDPNEIRKFLAEWQIADPRATDALYHPNTRILDPCAGGNLTPIDWVTRESKQCTRCGFAENLTECKKHDGKPEKVLHVPASTMSYPEAIGGRNITTLDIREDSPAQFHRDYLNDPLPMDGPPNLIISNPPFSQALEFIRHSLVMVAPNGYVVMLLRLNFFGSETRNEFFRAGNMPTDLFIHSKRLSFTPDGATDSIEYGHYVYSKRAMPCHVSQTRVLPYT